jgi:hypothetical protein
LEMRVRREDKYALEAGRLHKRAHSRSDR